MSKAADNIPSPIRTQCSIYSVAGTISAAPYVNNYVKCFVVDSSCNNSVFEGIMVLHIGLVYELINVFIFFLGYKQHYG